MHEYHLATAHWVANHPIVHSGPLPYVSGYLRIHNYLFPASKISTPTRIHFETEFSRPHVPRAPLEILVTECTVVVISCLVNMSSDVMWYASQSGYAIYRGSRGIGLEKNPRCSLVFSPYSFKLAKTCRTGQGKPLWYFHHLRPYTDHNQICILWILWTRIKREGLRKYAYDWSFPFLICISSGHRPIISA